MLIQPLSKDVLYIFIIIATVLLPVAGGLGSLYLKRSLDRHGHGIDGAGAAIVAAIVVKIGLYVAIGIYILMVVKIIQSTVHYEDVPDILIAVPFVPVVLHKVWGIWNGIRRNRERGD